MLLSFISSLPGRDMAQAVIRRSLTTEAWVRSQVSACDICGGQSGTGSGFSPSTSIFHCQYYSTKATNSSSSTCCSYQDKRAKPGNTAKKLRFFKKSGSNEWKSAVTFSSLKRYGKTVLSDHTKICGCEGLLCFAQVHKCKPSHAFSDDRVSRLTAGPTRDTKGPWNIKLQQQCCADSCVPCTRCGMAKHEAQHSTLVGRATNVLFLDSGQFRF
jgi:hypothetical protein